MSLVYIRCDPCLHSNRPLLKKHCILHVSPSKKTRSHKGYRYSEPQCVVGRNMWRFLCSFYESCTQGLYLCVGSTVPSLDILLFTINLMVRLHTLLSGCQNTKVFEWRQRSHRLYCILLQDFPELDQTNGHGDLYLDGKEVWCYNIEAQLWWVFIIAKNSPQPAGLGMPFKTSTPLSTRVTINLQALVLSGVISF